MSYAELAGHFERIGHLQHASAILQWDEAVMMPAQSGPERADAMAALASVLHELHTDPRLSDWLAGVDRGALSPWEQANVREIERVVIRARALPERLVGALTRAQLRCEQAWRKLRAESDFTTFAPLLSEVVSLKREAASALGAALGLSDYDALLDEFEPGCRAEQLDQIFEPLRAMLPGLIEEVLEKQRSEVVVVPRGPFPIDAQERLGRELMQAVGFDFNHGRLDVSHHPFCGGVPSDVRITTRYDLADFTKSLMGVLHETGHAKYEQALPRAFGGQPVGLARGMSTHEGQSLLQEMQVSRSRPFLVFAAPLIRKAFAAQAAAQPAAFEVDNLFRLYTRVSRSKIRVDADEVTYPCHILVRYDLERQLMAGTLRVEQLPEAWDQGMRELLRIRTGHDHRDGCMQDVHWPGGAFGYFPTYTLGAMTAAQVFAAAERELADVWGDVERGRFDALSAFLRERVWSHGSSLGTDDLMVQATGEPLNARFFEAHLRARYLA